MKTSPARAAKPSAKAEGPRGKSATRKPATDARESVRCRDANLRVTQACRGLLQRTIDMLK